MRSNIRIVAVLIVLTLFVYVPTLVLHAQEIAVGGERRNTRVAPGEEITFSIKLANFGSDRRADVTITYRILDNLGKELASEQETVAVDTTASFVKSLQIPLDVPNGTYILISSVMYENQEVPAVSSFSFLVEQKIFGVFLNDALRYGGFALGALVLGIVAARYVVRRRENHFIAYDYSDKPRQERIYYEIVSDAIAHMRLHAGDSALDIAAHIAGLTIDVNTGKVLAIKKSPEAILSSLVLRYETLLGRNARVSLRPLKDN